VADLELYLRGTPWFVPTVLIGVVLAAVILLTRRREHVVISWLTVMSYVGFLAATVTPSGSEFHWDMQRSFSWSFHVPGPAEMLRMNYDTVNVWIALPMGAMTGYWAAARGRRRLVAIPFVVALAAELLQVLVPPLGRSAFLLADVANTWIGVAVGVLTGWMFARAFGVRATSATRRATVRR